MGDAHSISGLPARLLLNETDEVLVLQDGAVHLQQLRVTIYGLRLQRRQTGLGVADLLFQHLGGVHELVHMSTMSGARSSGGALDLGRRRCL